MNVRTVLLTLLTVLSCNALFAQQTFQAGILGGLNTSQIHGDTYWGWNQVGGVGGLFVCTNPTQKVWYQMELQYSRKGSRKNINPAKNDYESFQLRMSYIEVPLLVKVNYRKLYFEGGLSAGVLFNVREWNSFGEIQPRDFRRWEASFILGGGYNFNSKFYFDVRTINSLAPVKKFDLPIYYPRFYLNLFNKGMYNNLLSFTFGYRFSGKSSKE
jgi:hypothetical protein